MGDNWHYAKDQTQHGPITFAALQQRAATGELRLTDLVWTDGMTQWAPASTVPGLFAQASTVVPSPTTDASPTPIVAAPVMGYYTPSDVGFQYVGFWWRFLAILIDYITLWIPAFIISLPTHFMAPQTASGQVNWNLVAYSIFSSVVNLVMYWLYFALMESSKHQATLGKIAIGVRVTDLEGQRLGFGHATGRFFGKILSAIILYIGFMMAGWTQKKQGLHDIMANTLVLKGRPTA